MAIYNLIDLLGLGEVLEYPGRGQSTSIPQEPSQVLIPKS